MKKLTYSFLLLMLLTSVPALADYAPVNVQTALKKMYPAAKDVAWSRHWALHPLFPSQSVSFPIALWS